MGSLKKRAYQSLSTRISVRVVAYATGLLLVALSVVLYISRQEAKKGAIEEATMVLDGTLLHIDNTLHQVETGTYNMHWNVEHHLDDPDIMVTSIPRKTVSSSSMPIVRTGQRTTASPSNSNTATPPTRFRNGMPAPRNWTSPAG